MAVALVVAMAVATATVLATVGAAHAADDSVLATYRKRFAKEGFLSDREDVLRGLADLGSPDAREAIVWCIARTREFLDSAQKESDRQSAKLKPLQDEFDEQFQRFLDQEAKKGNPNPATRPIFPVEEKLNAVRADLLEAEKRVQEERDLRDVALECHGRCVEKMPAPQQQALRDALVKGPLASKDWPARAEVWEQLRATQAEWVTKLLVDAAVKEADPRALIPALDALGGRDARLVVPVLAARLDDARWLVRAAAIGALERTPSRETIDAVVARFAAETGRLRDDCLRVLEAMTGADVARTPEAWKQWWGANREQWKGPPPKAAGPGVTEESLAKKYRKPENRTGFFGIETSSKRLCFVIDLSGSMNEKAADKGNETRADRAKVELVRAIRGLEDGSTFALVMFAHDVRIWRPDMTVAGDDTRKAAVAWVEASPVVGATNTYDALQAAFSIGEPSKSKPTDPYADPKLDTIVFLSDGKPTRGRTTKTDEIRAAVREWNKRRRVTIHAIAFGKDADFSFMEGLATDTGGTFTVP